MANVIFKTGTKSLYDAVQEKDLNTLYWLTDVQEVYKGDLLMGVGRVATQEAAGLLSPEDKAKLDTMSPGGIDGLTAVDSTIIIGEGESGGKTIGVQVSDEPDNALELKTDGLYVGIAEAEYALEKQNEAAEGYSVTYRLKKTVGGSSTYAGDPINIPKDLVLQSGSLKIVTEADTPYPGAIVGDPYIDLVLNDPTSSHIFIPMKGIVDTDELEDVYYTNGLTSLSQGTASSNIISAIGSYADLLAAAQANKIIVDKNAVDNSTKVAVYATGNDVALNLTFLTASDTMTIYQIQNVGNNLALGVTPIQYVRKTEIGDISEVKGTVESLPDTILSEIVNVQRTETTNSAEIRIFTKQSDGTYSPAVQHGVITLIPAGHGPDGISGAGLMSLADKQKLDSIDVDAIEAMAESLTWGTL